MTELGAIVTIDVNAESEIERDNANGNVDLKLNFFNSTWKVNEFFMRKISCFNSNRFFYPCQVQIVFLLAFDDIKTLI
jgi:hypothetical protein